MGIGMRKGGSNARRGESGFEFGAGAPCLDFANTVESRPDAARRRDRLGTYGDLVAWARAAGLLSAREAAVLARRAAARPRLAAAALGRAVALREAIYGIFSAVAAGRRPAARDLVVLNRALGAALGRLRVARGRDGYGWVWASGDRAGSPLSLDRPWWPVARSAAELLASVQLARVRECAASSCGWLFLDRSRNASRRWCDMRVCGNREKARRFYRRRRAGARG